jgi:hypothetical protein
MVKSVFEGILVTEGAPGQMATASGARIISVTAPAGIQTTIGSAPVAGTRVAPGAGSWPVLIPRTVVWKARFMSAIGVKHASLTFAKHP